MRKAPLASLALGLVFAAVAATSAVAAGPGNGLEVTPATVIRGTAPGRLVEETVTVVNLSQETYNVTARLDDARVDQKGRFGGTGPGSGLPSAVPWGTVQPASFTLPAGHTQNVLVSFTPPKGIEGGGYYAMVDFGGLPGSGVASSAGQAVLLEVSGNNVIRAPTIAKISAPAMTFGSSIPVTMRLENTGNDYAVAEGTLTVIDMFSNKASTVEIPRTPVVPGTPRILTVNVPTPLMPGRMHVKAHMTFGLGVPEDSATTGAYAIGWWQLGVAIALILLILRLSIAIVRWRRRRRALKRERRAAEHEMRPPVPTAANGGGFADYEPLEQKTPVSTPAESVAVERGSAEPEEIEHAAFAPPETDTDDLWPAPVVVPRAPKETVEERPRPRLVFSRPADDPFEELAKLSDPDAGEEDEGSTADDREEPVADVSSGTETETGLLAAVEAALGDEPEQEPEQEPIVAPSPAVVAPPPAVVATPARPPAAPLTVVRPLPAEEYEAPAMPIAAGDSTAIAARVTAAPAAAPSVAPPMPDEQHRDAADRRARLSEQLFEDIAATPAKGREAAQRRARVAIEMLTTGKGRSAERVDVALKILRSSGADASAMLSEALDAAVAAGNEKSLASLALALHQVAGGRALEALLRAYAVAPRGQIVAIRTALKSFETDALSEHDDLLAALPADRRAALRSKKP